MVDASHTWPLNTWNMDWAAEELPFTFNLHLNSHVWLASTVMDSAAPDKFTAFCSFLQLWSL